MVYIFYIKLFSSKKSSLKKIKLEKFKTKHVNVKEFCEKIREGISDEHEAVTVEEEKCSGPGGWTVPSPRTPDKTSKKSRSEEVKAFENDKRLEPKNLERNHKKSWNDAAKSTIFENDPFIRLASRGGRKIDIDIEPTSFAQPSRKVSEVKNTCSSDHFDIFIFL